MEWKKIQTKSQLFMRALKKLTLLLVLYFKSLWNISNDHSTALGKQMSNNIVNEFHDLLKTTLDGMISVITPSRQLTWVAKSKNFYW